MNINSIHDYEGLYIHHDKAVNLIAIVALHSTTLGAAMGGCRLMSYPSVDAAINDAMQLAKAMSRKCALTGLAAGGGKAVIIRPEVMQDREAFFKSFAEFINSLNGRYYTSIDIGISQSDLVLIAQHTPYTVGNIEPESKELMTASWLTAQTTFFALKSAVQHHFNHNDFGNHKIVIQGLGKVGSELLITLIDAGAQPENITICDIDPEAVERCLARYPHLQVVNHHEVATLECDIFAPCAIGGVVNADNINKLKAKIICGGTNNILADDSFAQMLLDRGVTFVPDFISNAGGVILASMKLNGYDIASLQLRAQQIEQITLDVLEKSSLQQRSTLAIACEMADSILAQGL